MPEGPEVRRVAEWLHQQLVGKYLLNVEWTDKSCYKNIRKYPASEPNNYSAVKPLFPLLFTNVHSHGKIIIFSLERDGREVFMTNHLNMEGRWTQDKQKHSDLWLVLSNEMSSGRPTEERLYFTDTRKFGYLAFHASRADLEADLNKKVGPDLLTIAICGIPMLEEWHKTALRRKRSAVSDFLHNQHNFSGIGNYLRAEIMYEARIDPRRKMGDLSTEELDLLYERSLSIIEASYRSHGLTISSYRDPAGFKGTYEVKVYNRSFDDCGNAVEKYKKSGGQTVHWCPTVQK